MRAIQADKQLGEIHLPHELPNWWHQDVVNEGRDDFAEGCADDYADCQIQHVATHHEGFEFFQHADSPIRRLTSGADYSGDCTAVYRGFPVPTGHVGCHE